MHSIGQTKKMVHRQNVFEVKITGCLLLSALINERPSLKPISLKPVPENTVLRLHETRRSSNQRHKPPAEN